MNNNRSISQLFMQRSSDHILYSNRCFIVCWFFQKVLWSLVFEALRTFADISCPKTIEKKTSTLSFYMILCGKVCFDFMQKTRDVKLAIKSLNDWDQKYKLINTLTLNCINVQQQYVVYFQRILLYFFLSKISILNDGRFFSPDDISFYILRFIWIQTQT